MPSLGYLYDHPDNVAAISNPLNWPMSLLVQGLPTTVPTSYLDPDIGSIALDQDGIGACVAFAGETIKQAEDKKDWGKELYVSGAWTNGPSSTGAFLGYWWLKHGTPDGSFPGDGSPNSEGSWPTALWNMAKVYGVPARDGTPHKISAYYFQVSSSPADDLVIQQTIMAHGPVNVATIWPNNWMSAPAGPLYQMPEPNWGSIAGGHSYTIAGWMTLSGELWWVCVNSWGTAWTNIRGMFMIKASWLHGSPAGPAPVWKPVDLPDAPIPPTPENKMLGCMANTTQTPWDQLIDLEVDKTVITSVDGRQVTVKSGGVGVYSPFATDATHRAVYYSTGGVAQIGTVSDWTNMRDRITPPAPVDTNAVYDGALNDVINQVNALRK